MRREAHNIMEGREIRESTEKVNRRKKYRRNFVDVLIFFLIAASIASFFFRGWMEKTVNRFLADDSAAVSFVIQNLDADVAADFGLLREFSYENKSFGNLQEYQVQKSTKRVVRTHSLDGSSVFASVEQVNDPHCRNIEGSILIRGTRKDSGFYLNGNTKIAAGMTFEISTKEQKYTILVTKIG